MVSSSVKNLDYDRIAELEIGIYGQTQPCAGSPHKEGETSLVSKYAAYVAQVHYDAWQEAYKLRDQQAAWNPGSQDPEWTDEDGKPW